MRFSIVVLTMFPHLLFEASLWQSLASETFKTIFGTIVALDNLHRTFLGMFIYFIGVELLVPSQPPTFPLALIRRYVVRTVSVFLALCANCVAICLGVFCCFHVEGIGDPGTCRFWVRLRAIVIDETIEPAPQLAVFSTLADKHRKLHPDYGDQSRVEDLHIFLRTSAVHSPYVTPLYLVVVRDLNSGQRLTFATLALPLHSATDIKSALQINMTLNREFVSAVHF